MRRYRLRLPVDSDTSEILDRNEIVSIGGKVYIGDGVNPIKYLSKVDNYAFVTGLTTNATPLVVTQIDLQDNSSGIIELKMFGSDTILPTKAYSGIKYYAYKKFSGTLTISAATTIIDNNLGYSSSPTWQGQNTSNVFEVQVTGLASTTILWHLYFRLTDFPV